MATICELCGEPLPAGEETFRYHGYSGDCPKPPKSKEAAPIEEQIVAIFHDFRARRLKNMVNNPDSITDESRVPEELSRLAEARAVYDIVKRDLGHYTAPDPDPAQERDHLARQCEILLAENRDLRDAMRGGNAKHQPLKTVVAEPR